MTHIEAIMGAAGMRYSGASEYGPLASNGHIAIRGEFGGKELADLSKLWAELSLRNDAPAEIGCIVQRGDDFLRILRDPATKKNFAISEAYYRAMVGHPHILRDNKQVAFRANGILVGIVMPAGRPFPEESLPEEPSDAKVFESFACEANDYYLQPQGYAEGKLKAELADIGKRLRRAIDSRDEAEEEIEGLELEQREITAKLKTLKDTAAVAAQRSLNSKPGR